MRFIKYEIKLFGKHQNGKSQNLDWLRLETPRGPSGPILLQQDHSKLMLSTTYRQLLKISKEETPQHLWVSVTVLSIQPAGDTLPSAAQDTTGLFALPKGTLLAHVELGDHWDLQVLFCIPACLMPRVFSLPL